MDFKTTNVVHPATEFFFSYICPGLGLLALTLLLALIFTALLAKKRKTSYENVIIWMAGGIFGSIVAVVFGGLILMAVVGGYEADQSRANYFGNIEAKYDIEEASNPIEERISPRTDTLQEVLIKVDGKNVIFLVEQDPETFEPTLSDPPQYAGQSVNNEVISTEDLKLRK